MAEGGGPLLQVARVATATVPTFTAHARCLGLVRLRLAAPAGTDPGRHPIRQGPVPGHPQAAALETAGAAVITAGGGAPAAIATTVTTGAAEAAAESEDDDRTTGAFKLCRKMLGKVGVLGERSQKERKRSSGFPGTWVLSIRRCWANGF